MKKLLVAAVALVLTACASTPSPRETAAPTPVLTEAHRKIALEARAQVQNKRENKTYTVQLEAVAVEPTWLRLDVTGGFGSEFGKMVMQGNQITILLPQQKKAYSGIASENSLRPLLPVRLNPKDLVSFLIGDVPKGWSCQKENPQTETCLDPSKSLTLHHDPGPEGAKEKWSVIGEQFALTVLPTQSRTNVQVKSDLFSMPIPDGYSKHKLP